MKVRKVLAKAVSTFFISKCVGFWSILYATCFCIIDCRYVLLDSKVSQTDDSDSQKVNEYAGNQPANGEEDPTAYLKFLTGLNEALPRKLISSLLRNAIILISLELITYEANG
jgi:hypothetical protein